MTADQLEQLNIAGREVLEAWHRPVFVEFAGTPKSGKSTCIDIVNHFFRRLGFKVLAPTEGASKRTPYYLKENLVAFNAWSATYALTHILEGRYGSDEYQLVILDRGLFDALAWFELLKSRGDISEAERTKIHDFLLIDHWRQYVDMVFMFKTDPKTSLTREYKDKLIEEPGQTMNEGFLDELNDAYVQITERYADEFDERLTVIDTSSNQCTTPQSTGLTVASEILEHVRKGANHR